MARPPAAEARGAFTAANGDRVLCPLKRQNLFAHRVEIDAALLHVGDVAEVRGLSGAMPHQHVAVRQAPRLHTVEEVLDVVQVNRRLRLYHYRLDVAAQRVELVAAAIDPQAALGAAELLGRASDAGHKGSEG